jgi:hypothetical protein
VVHEVVVQPFSVPWDRLAAEAKTLGNRSAAGVPGGDVNLNTVEVERLKRVMT